MAHIFLDETKSAGPIAVLGLVALPDESLKKLSEILALPDPASFNPDAYNLLYRLDNNELKNPEYAFRRVQRAYFSPFSFSEQIRKKVDSVFSDISSLDFKVILTIYQPQDANKYNLSQTGLKSYYTRTILAYYINNCPSELTRESIVCADNGFYNSKTLHLVKTTFRGPPRVGIVNEDSPDLKYHHQVDKQIDIRASYDSKGIQLADLVVGVAGRALYKQNNCEPFYSTIKNKVITLLDNRHHIPKATGNMRHPTSPNDHVEEIITRPDLTKIRT